MKNVATKIRSILISFVLVLAVFTSLTPLARAEANYSCGSYGASSYSENCDGNTKNKGGLSQTGKHILTYLILSLLLIAGGTALLLKTRNERANKKSSHRTLGS